MSPSISIVIATCNRSSSLRATLAELSNVVIPQGWDVELVVVDNASTDDTSEVVRNFMPRGSVKLKHLQQPVKGKSCALNLAMAQASGNVFLFSDDDIRFPGGWIREMCQPALDRRADLVQGGIRWAPHLAGRLSRESYLPGVITSTRHKTEAELSQGLIGANMAFGRHVYEALGDFNEELGPGRLGLGEETLYGWKAAKAGFTRMNLLSTEVEHHFDASRLTFAGILDLATRKGKSLGFLDYHWFGCGLGGIRPRLLAARIKNSLRSFPDGFRSKQGALPTAWKYSYTAQIARLSQILVESRRARLTL